MIDGYDAQDIGYEMKKGQLEAFIEEVKHSLQCLEVACDDIGMDYESLVEKIIEGEV